MTADHLQRLRRAVALDLTPLRESRDYRLLYVGRTVSYAGSMLTTVAFPYRWVWCADVGALETEAE